MEITADLTLPALLRAHPSARAVLDKYGLRGCGGRLGPEETLGFFARAHDVPLEKLLRELDRTARRPAPPNRDAPENLADWLYRPFFKSGIAIALTAGASWGALLLLQIAFARAFTGAELHQINAHGHAQIFGWVGLFVMGFAYQAFPRFKHTSLAWPRAAMATLVAMIAGITLRSVGEPFGAVHSWAYWCVVAAALLETAAVLTFCAVLITTWLGAGKPLVEYDYYIASSLVWFVIQAVYDGCYTIATLGADSASELVSLVATWQAPLRDLQIHGFALLMILGVSQRVFHHFYGLPPGNKRLSLALIAPLNLAVIGEASGLILMHLSGNHLWALVAYLSSWLLAVCCAMLVWNWHIFRPAPDHDRTLKFLRAAYVWLFVSLTMLLMMPVYMLVLLPHFAPDSAAAEVGFSHAYYGAVRHAITVGFVSLMIMGVAAKVVPTLNGISQHRLPALWLPYVLINLGCTLRVVGQTATDLTATSFSIAGVSGLLEVTALAIWGVHLWRIMASGRSTAPTATSAVAVHREPAELTGEWTVAEVLEQWPQLAETFVAFGFHAILDRRLRNTLGRIVTLDKACRRMDVDLALFLTALKRRLGDAGCRSAEVLVSIDALRESGKTVAAH
jgi:hypothetical protein